MEQVKYLQVLRSKEFNIGRYKICYLKVLNSGSLLHYLLNRYAGIIISIMFILPSMRQSGF